MINGKEKEYTSLELNTEDGFLDSPENRFLVLIQAYPGP